MGMGVDQGHASRAVQGPWIGDSSDRTLATARGGARGYECNGLTAAVVPPRPRPRRRRRRPPCRGRPS
eukprot:7375918-Prymnesium_polylepis.1